jgi:hypothetical protein
VFGVPSAAFVNGGLADGTPSPAEMPANFNVCGLVELAAVRGNAGTFRLLECRNQGEACTDKTAGLCASDVFQLRASSLDLFCRPYLRRIWGKYFPV